MRITSVRQPAVKKEFDSNEYNVLGFNGLTVSDSIPKSFDEIPDGFWLERSAVNPEGDSYTCTISKDDMETFQVTTYFNPEGINVAGRSDMINKPFKIIRLKKNKIKSVEMTSYPINTLNLYRGNHGKTFSSSINIINDSNSYVTATHGIARSTTSSRSDQPIITREFERVIVEIFTRNCEIGVNGDISKIENINVTQIHIPIAIISDSIVHIPELNLTLSATEKEIDPSMIEPVVFMDFHDFFRFCVDNKFIQNVQSQIHVLAEDHNAFEDELFVSVNGLIVKAPINFCGEEGEARCSVQLLHLLNIPDCSIEFDMKTINNGEPGIKTFGRNQVIICKSLDQLQQILDNNEPVILNDLKLESVDVILNNKNKEIDDLKKQLEFLKEENERKNQTLKNDKVKLENKIIELERQIKSLEDDNKHKSSLIDLEKQRIEKEIQESKARREKVTTTGDILSSTLKVIGAFVSAAAVIFLAYEKLKNKKEFSIMNTMFTFGGRFAFGVF